MSEENKVENGTPAGATTETVKAKRPASPHKILPTDRLSPEKWQAAARAYAVVFESNGGKPVTNNEAGAIIGMAGNTIVMTNAFFLRLEIAGAGEGRTVLHPFGGFAGLPQGLRVESGDGGREAASGI